jgi:hypothetical protein
MTMLTRPLIAKAAKMLYILIQSDRLESRIYNKLGNKPARHFALDPEWKLDLYYSKKTVRHSGHRKGENGETQDCQKGELESRELEREWNEKKDQNQSPELLRISQNK